MLRDDSGPNRCFLHCVFCDQSVAIAFQQDIGLLPNTMPCNTCGRDMTWTAAPNIHEVFRWRCHRRVTGVRCNQSASIKQGSSLQQDNLTIQDILLITYDTVCRERATKIQSEYRLSAHTAHIPSQTGACSAGKSCWCFLRAALMSLMVLTRLPRLMRTSSIGANTIGDTLLRVSGFSVVLNECLAKQSLFQYRTEPPTH